jgi:pre-mRNA-splicing factor ISY1
MARPAEKARSMLNKWVAMREGGDAQLTARRQNRRPHLASQCEHLADAERFRGQILKEITNLIAELQNPALATNTIMELNDEVNRKIREKYYWNKRIVELGGRDFAALEKQRQIEQGDTQLYAGYRYFGVAKDLPGVAEELEKQEAMRNKKRGGGDRSEGRQGITPDYYGWRDEEDGVLLELEEEATNKIVSSKKSKTIQVIDMETIANLDYLDVPTSADIQQHLLEEKKKALVSKLLGL